MTQYASDSTALSYDLRRARALAAREYAPGYMPRVGIRTGQWDNGEVVRKHMHKQEEE